MRVSALVLLAVVASSLTACVAGNDPPAVCSTNDAWTSGDEGSPLMHPGDDCIGCHSQGEGPRYTIAGTVMNASNDDTNCNGVEGATVVITDANGKTLSLPTNAAGNFYTRETIAMPYKAKVVYQGKENVMADAQGSGSCASCHTAQGANGAPGRVIVAK